MPTVDDLGKSNYLRQVDCTPPLQVTIKGFEKVNMARQGEREDMKWILTFHENVKPLSLNKTNGNRIAVIAGSADFVNWVGKRIELFVDDMVEFGGKLVGGISVRRPSGPPTQPSGPNPDYVGDDPPPPTDDDIPY